MVREPSSHVEVAKYYQVVWKSAFGDSKIKVKIPKEILSASRKGNFSGIGRLIKNFAVDKPHKVETCLSIGCGTARDLKTVKDLYPSSIVVGIDASRNALLEAKKGLSEGNFICSCIAHLPLKKKVEFDTVIAGHVLEYLSKNSLKKSLAEVSDYAAKGSRFYITFWEKSKSRHELDRMFFEIELDLMRYGWEIVHVEAYSYREISPLAEGGFIVADKKLV